MAPTVPLVAALFHVSNADLDLQEDSSLLQMKNVETIVETDATDSECVCPGYFEDDCRAHAEQGCTWSDAGDSNAPWCQCNEEQWQAWREEQRQNRPTPTTLPPTASHAPDTIQYLVVGGGGGGGSGGGGAGGVQQGTMAAPLQESITIEVGAGGPHGSGGSGGTTLVASAGGDSVFNALEPVIAHGGGFGAGPSANDGAGGEGGSGGGGRYDRQNAVRTSGMSGEGNGGGRSDRGSYGAGGGGGGAGGPGQDAPQQHIGGDGGPGVTSDVGCVEGQWYGGGGGGGVNANDGNNGDGNRGGVAGQGGGGTGSSYGGGRGQYFTGTDGVAATGGGGGGTDPESELAGNGGSGIVKIKYAGPQFYEGGTVESCDGFTVHTFDTPGVHELRSPAGSVQQNCDEVTRPEGEWIDVGYVDAWRGWYDVSGCGSCNDYCRWVGNSGSGGDPASQLSHGDSWWSCRLAGTDEIYSPRDHFSSFPHQRCESHIERLQNENSCEIVVRAEAEWIDEGYVDDYRGWYDVSGCGTCHDYCRWVGNSGSGGDPASQVTHGSSWWSCRLAGTNEIYSPQGYFDGSFSYDRCEQCFGNYEAEDATISGAREHTPPTTAPHQGFSGRSFVDYINANDDYIQWTIDSCNSGDVTLSFRYALASGDRPLQVLVNGEEVASSLSTPATGSWSNYGNTAGLAATFEAGSNTVKLVAIGSSGANVDSLIIS